ncbi:MAG: hypothetical protein MJ118_07505 [Clostridia bacterium]|nr:hypothetical protein [Clostridia bacterium]
MEKRISYYVSRKNLLIWLAALCMVGSAVIRIAFCGKGAETKTVWFQIVLPVAACLIYVLILLLNGEERFYRTSVPVFMLAIYYGIKISSGNLSIALDFAYWVAFLAIAWFYTSTVSGRVKSTLPLIALLGFGLAVILYTNRHQLRSGDWNTMAPLLPDILFVLGGWLVLPAMKIHLDGKYHPTWGDRSDGRKLRSLDPIQVVGNYIMPTRTGSSNFVRDSIEITNMERYIREKRKQGLTNFGITHVFLAAYVRAVAKYPAVNRFLSGQQVYSRDDDIQFCMVVKAEMATDGQESIAKLHLKPTDTAADIYRKLNEEVERIKNQPVGASDFDKVAKLFSFIPGLLFKFTVWLLRVLDYFGLLPKFLLEVSPFHASIFFTSMGSLGIPPIVHHLYEFGNMPVFCAFGCKRHENEVQEDGTVVRRKYVDYTFNTDERICDGFYFATVLKYVKKLLAHPERLDDPPEEVIRDID